MKTVSVLAVALVLSTPVVAQEKTAMTQSELEALTAEGVTLTLGTPELGYSGELVLSKDGTGAGGAKTNDGREITINGTWAVTDGKFCRKWADLNDGEEVCETWMKTSETSVDVMVGDEMIGVNSW